MKKFTVLFGVLAVLMSVPNARADFTLDFNTGTQVYPADTPIGIGVIGLNNVPFTSTTQQYSSYGVSFYSGPVSTLQTYSWYPKYSFYDNMNLSAVTALMGPTFETPAQWTNRENGAPTAGNYPPGETPTVDFLGFDKNSLSQQFIDGGTVMKFDFPIYSLSLQLSRPGAHPANTSEIYIYLFNSAAAGGTKLVASKLEFTTYSGGDGTAEWDTYSSPREAHSMWQSSIHRKGLCAIISPCLPILFRACPSWKRRPCCRLPIIPPYKIFPEPPRWPGRQLPAPPVTR